MDSRLTLRASYFSCYTQNQNDELFRLVFNVIVTDSEARETRYRVEQTCRLALAWASREVMCEENYMEVVTMEKHGSCTASEGMSKESWNTALSTARRTASFTWQVTLLRDGHSEDTMPFSRAYDQGYVLNTTSTRVVFRTTYGQPHSQTVLVDGIATEVIKATVYYREKWAIVMLDMTAACTTNPGTFDGERLRWAVPRVPAPLVQEPPSSASASEQIRMGVDGQLMEDDVWRARGLSLEYAGSMINISVPFGAAGGYRKSFVLNNVYHEIYAIFMYYEHAFLRVYEHGSTDDTRHRMMRLLQTPSVCRKQFTIDETVPDERKFTVLLGHFPADVELVSLKLNGVLLTITEAIQHGFSVMTLSNMNGTHGYVLEVPFDDPVVHRAYLGEGLLQYSMNINYTLHVLPQAEPFYHLASVLAQIHNAFPPDVSATCTEASIIFRISEPTVKHLWEVGVGHHPLTTELARQRGYVLTNNTRGLVLEAPVFTRGYTYENITLKQFIGVFKVMARDSKTLDVQSIATKYCIFDTDELIVCSKSGIMTLVAKTNTTWPTVPTTQITLRDKSCKPQEAHDNRILFSFSLNSCGTKFMVGDSYVVYENEIVSAKQYIPKSNPVITRDSKFRLTVQCFYPLASVRSLFMEGMFLSDEPGFGSINVKTTHSASGGTADRADCGDKNSGGSKDPEDTFTESTNYITGTESLSSTGIHPASEPPQTPTRPLFRSRDGYAARASLLSEMDVLPREDTEAVSHGFSTGNHLSAYLASPDGYRPPAKLHPSDKVQSPASASVDQAPWKESTSVYHRYRPKSSQNTDADKKSKASHDDLVSSTEPSIVDSSYNKDEEKDIFPVFKSYPNVEQVDKQSADHSPIQSVPQSNPESVYYGRPKGSSAMQTSSEAKTTSGLRPDFNSNAILGPVQNPSWTDAVKSNGPFESHSEGLRDTLTGQHFSTAILKRHSSPPVSSANNNLEGRTESSRDTQNYHSVHHEPTSDESWTTPVETNDAIHKAPMPVRDFRLASRHLVDDMTKKIRNMLYNFVPKHFAPPQGNLSLHRGGTARGTSNLSLPQHTGNQLVLNPQQHGMSITGSLHHDLANQGLEGKHSHADTKLVMTTFQPSPDFGEKKEKDTQSFRPRSIRKDFIASAHLKPRWSEPAPSSTDPSTTRNRYGPSVHKGILRGKGNLQTFLNQILL
ncbi:hypothetical protein ACEWY4_022128 [Coilia grayii]|uniref:ZP domain-containing protein n=1 Tax=Coilia grayii TaxID=363190 RepID=A0ABD1J556_9TELE